jgi:hypothetical protein
MCGFLIVEERKNEIDDKVFTIELNKFHTEDQMIIKFYKEMRLFLGFIV